MSVFLLSDELVFPPPSLSNNDGLLAVGGDLHPERLLLAYRKGIFPWYSEGEPIMWWSPDPRLVLCPHELKISRSLRKIIRKGVFRATFDNSFMHVIDACADTRLANGTGTWITRDMRAAYCRLHALGYAHSVEVWHEERLAGGLYGIAMGRMFFGESMFSVVSNASKVCLYHLTQYLNRNAYMMIDCQLPSRHLQSMGARAIPRGVFLAVLHEALRHHTALGSWA